MKSLQTPHEESADTSQRVRGIAEKDLQMKCREFKWLASWELLGLFLSAIMISKLEMMVLFVTKISNFASQLLCG